MGASIVANILTLRTGIALDQEDNLLIHVVFVCNFVVNPKMFGVLFAQGRTSTLLENL
jgi:hypothetical protein